MNDLRNEISPDTVREICRLMSHQLSAAGIQESDVAVRSGQDHDGDPAILVQVRHRSHRHPFDARAAARASFSLNSMLRDRGERRFAYIKHDEESDS